MNRATRKLIREDAIEIGREYLKGNPRARLPEIGRHVRFVICKRRGKGRYGFVWMISLAAALLSIYISVKTICEELDDPDDEKFMAELVNATEAED